MNRLLTRGLALSLLFLPAKQSLAQIDRAAKRSPINSAQTAFDNMFSLPQGDTAYFFRVNLRGDNFMTIRFRQIGFWENNALKDVVDVARLGWEQLRDSLRGNATSRRVALSVPESNYPVLTAYREWGADERIMMLGRNGASPVRIAYDTLSVLRSYKNNTADTSMHRKVLYTFLLKDLDQIQDISDDSGLIGDISRSFDSVLQVRKLRWKSPEAATHGLGLDYNVASDAKTPKIQRWYEDAWYEHFNYTGEIGTGFLAGQIALTSALRLAYNLQSNRPGSNTYVALSYSALGFFREEAKQLETKGVGFLNFEFGSVITGLYSGLPVYRTSVGFGYRIAQQNAAPYNFRYRIFFNYGVTKSINLMPEVYFIPKKDRLNNESFSAGGLTLSVRLF
jgi:hypothetical protein